MTSSSHDVKPQAKDQDDTDVLPSTTSSDLSSRDNSFCQFRRLCEDLEKEPSYNSKTKLIATYLKYGNSGSKNNIL